MNYTNNLPYFYILASVLFLVLVTEAIFKKNRTWSIPAVIVYLTTALWYLTEQIYSPENLIKFNKSLIEITYLQVVLFLVSFRLFLPILSYKFKPQKMNLHKVLITLSLNPARLLAYLSIVWLGLLMFGFSRMNGDILGALFPINSRAGGHMWGRAAGAAAGSSGFIVSSASYTYLLVCSFFGILLILQTKQNIRIINLILVLISWPYFILMGSRNQFLAVALPSIITYALLSRQRWWIKTLILGAAFITLNYTFSIVIAYRNIGFSAFFNGTIQGMNFSSEQKHLGLNMVEELCFINNFYKQGILHLSYGGRYIAEFLNFVPRAIWPDKPLVGINYAILRGFGDSSRDIGVFATISTGFIGQGVTNFGLYLGPVAPGLILAFWGAFLARLWSQRYSILRLCLFLAGLGITFNLGRDITLLVLWPIIFGYVLVRILERLNTKKIYLKKINH